MASTPLFLGQRDDAGDVQVGADRAFALADEVGFVGLEAVDAEAVFLGVNGDGAQTQFGGGAKDADGDLAAVGDEQFFEGRGAAEAGRPRRRGRRAILRNGAVGSSLGRLYSGRRRGWKGQNAKAARFFD